MGYVTEPKGITLTVEKQKLTAEAEDRIKGFIAKSKLRNADLISKLDRK